jgi:hypothetical protein
MITTTKLMPADLADAERGGQCPAELAVRCVVRACAEQAIELRTLVISRVHCTLNPTRQAITLALTVFVCVVHAPGEGEEEDEAPGPAALVVGG